MYVLFAHLKLYCICFINHGNAHLDEQMVYHWIGKSILTEQWETLFLGVFLLFTGQTCTTQI